jgi:hypothetical protein
MSCTCCINKKVLLDPIRINEGAPVPDYATPCEILKRISKAKKSVGKSRKGSGYVFTVIKNK